MSDPYWQHLMRPETDEELFLIAEIGINHNGDLDIAKKMIQLSADAGFDAVKFQKRTIEIVYAPEALDVPRESPWGTTNREQKQGLEFSHDAYREIDRHCKELGIQWSASAWDVPSQHFVRNFDVPFNKVASAMLGHKPLLNEIAEERKRTFVSTGMSTIDELDEVVDIFRKKDCPFELMHCNSSYPMEEANANLLCIPMLRERYDCKVGYSGHESSLIKVCVAAVTLGATSIERHVTLDRAMYGSDQAASITCSHLREFVDAVRRTPTMLGNGVKTLREEEREVREKLRRDVVAGD